jgi:hypothetical protein
MFWYLWFFLYARKKQNAQVMYIQEVLAFFYFAKNHQKVTHFSENGILCCKFLLFEKQSPKKSQI